LQNAQVSADDLEDDKELLGETNNKEEITDSS